MIVWSARRDPHMGAPAAFVEAAIRDRERLMRRLQRRT